MARCDQLAKSGWVFELETTYLEIYNETIRDLLVPRHEAQPKLLIRTNSRGKNYVDGLVRFTVTEATQIEEIMEQAGCNRSVAETDMNEVSSRSHSVFTMHIYGYNDNQGTELEGSLNLVDLAGSERVSRSNATGERLKEAQAINKSLSSIADVFSAIGNGTPHIPYRNSKLTQILQPALSGDGKTLMMVNLSPTEDSINESISSLRFASHVNQCELGAPTRNIRQKSNWLVFDFYDINFNHSH